MYSVPFILWILFLGNGSYDRNRLFLSKLSDNIVRTLLNNKYNTSFTINTTVHYNLNIVENHTGKIAHNLFTNLGEVYKHFITSVKLFVLDNYRRSSSLHSLERSTLFTIQKPFSTHCTSLRATALKCPAIVSWIQVLMSDIYYQQCTNAQYY